MAVPVPGVLAALKPAAESVNGSPAALHRAWTSVNGHAAGVTTALGDPPRPVNGSTPGKPAHGPATDVPPQSADGSGPQPPNPL
jgi:hypothetical protein